MSGGDSEEMKVKGLVDGFSPTSETRIFWNSRKRTANGRSKNNVTEESLKPLEQTEEHLVAVGNSLDPSPSSLSDKRKALFEPLEPTSSTNKLRTANETLLPPPDFDSTSYPKGWLIGKKRKLVNVDVVESMRRIAIQEMNRKDREIDGLNEQLEEDARCVEHMQLQLLQERSKRADLERENGVLKSQISMLMDMLHDPQEPDDEMPPDDM